MFAKSIMFVVGSSALMLGCADQPSEPSEQEIISNLTGLYSQPIFQTGTPLDHDEDSFGEFKMADMDLDGRPDLVFIKRRATGSGNIEVHVVSAASGYQQVIQHTATALSEDADTTGDFTMADVDLDGMPDLVFIKRRSTGTGTIEVHVLSAASGFGAFIQHTGTALSGAEDGNGDFTMADVDRDGSPDLVFFKGQNTGTGTVELHAVSAASGFQQFILHTATALTETEAAFGNFTMADVDLDGGLDLGFIKRRKTASGAIEVHALSSASGFQQFIQHVASGFSQVDDGNGDFTMKDVNLDGMPDLVFIKRRSTGTGTIEVHGFAG
jgi:G:T-mismatch repair DNA endonuclease (very short patch repair protein)